MRLSTRSRSYICLPCQFKTGRLYAVTSLPRRTLLSHRVGFSSSRILEDENGLEGRNLEADGKTLTSFSSGFSQTVGVVKQKKVADQDEVAAESRRPPRLVKSRSSDGHASVGHQRGSENLDSHSKLRDSATSTTSTIELTDVQRQELHVIHSLKERLTRGLTSVPEIRKDPTIINGLPIDDILQALPKDGQSPLQEKIIARLGSKYTGASFKNVKVDLDLASSLRNPSQRFVTDPKAKDVLSRLGIIETVPDQSQSAVETKNARPGQLIRRPSLAEAVASNQSALRRVPARATNPDSRPPTLRSHVNKSHAQSVDAKDLILSSIDTGEKTHLPQLSFDLSRVLFNPGVYQLQDPRSRVYNFDPYLEHLMPVSDFKFDALNPYLTSSEDETLLDLARNHKKRYVGSSSSMTAIMSHFHFLLSNWRPLNFEHLTKGFRDENASFTNISRSPAAIFLRYRNGAYAVDADKEYDEPNVLMSFGHMMEKLLTLERSEFEKWSKKKSTSSDESIQQHPEEFHYSEQGRFLLRSQLDVHDPRLPGTGYFDLKTRAVAGIRMNMRNHEVGTGYQIKERYGTWESYEREYYDMARSTFLKYSLQARMGHMDGIFVAYHNIVRMFGFQYVPLSEMDMVLHGQSDPCLGDQEFRLSINFLEEIFDMGTKEYPGRSLRIHFETREGTLTEATPYMNIFIEPMTEDDIKTVQTSQKAQFENFERKVLRGEDPDPIVDVEGEVKNEVTADESKRADASEETAKSSGYLPINTPPASADPRSSAANTAFLDSILNTKAARTEPNHEARGLMALKLTVSSKVNERPVGAPEMIEPRAKWSIDYSLERRSDEMAWKLYRQCRSRRSAALKTVLGGSEGYYVQAIRQMSEKGAEWRRKQDELDAQREQVVLYGKQQSE